MAARVKSLSAAVQACEIRLGRTGVSVEERIEELRDAADEDLIDLMYQDECHALLDLFEAARGKSE